MKNNKKAVIIICIVVVLLLGLLLLFGLLADREDEKNPDIYPPSNLADDPTPVPTRLIVIDGDSSTSTNLKTELVTLRYYSVSSSNIPNQTAEVVVEANKRIDPDLVLEYLVESLEDEEILLRVNKTSLNGSICNVDFDSSIGKISEKSAVMEVHILDAVAMSILDNCEDIRGVSFSIDGKRYETENIAFGEGEVYLSD